VDVKKIKNKNSCGGEKIKKDPLEISLRDHLDGEKK
jgi:hypothetical protein